MSAVKKISRSDIDLPSSKTSLQEEEPFYLPDFEFEFIEVDNSNNNDTNEREQHEAVEATVGVEDDNNGKEEDEYEFPLFNITTAPDVPSASTVVIDNDDRGRGEGRVVQKISLRDTSVERVPESRPDSYYFAKISPSQSQEIAQCAISGDEIIRQSLIPLPDSHPWRVIDLEELNNRIAKDIAITDSQQGKKKRQRLGKKKREEVIKSRERKLQRAKLEKKLALELKKKLLKKIHHKRGGKKNKKNNSAVTKSKPAMTKSKPAGAKPKRKP